MSGVQRPSQPSLFLNPFNMRRGSGEEENPSVNKTTAFFLSVFAAFLSHKFLPKDIRGTISLLSVGVGVLYSFCDCGFDKVLGLVGKFFSSGDGSSPSRRPPRQRKLFVEEERGRQSSPPPSSHTTYSYRTPPPSSFGRGTSVGMPPSSYGGVGTSPFPTSYGDNSWTYQPPTESGRGRGTQQYSAEYWEAKRRAEEREGRERSSAYSSTREHYTPPTVMSSDGVHTTFHPRGRADRGETHGRKPPPSSSLYPTSPSGFPPVPSDHPSQQPRSGDSGVTPPHSVVGSDGVRTTFHPGGKNRGSNHGKKGDSASGY